MLLYCELYDKGVRLCLFVVLFANRLVRSRTFTYKFVSASMRRAPRLEALVMCLCYTKLEETVNRTV